MKTRFIIDVPSGAITRTVAGVAVPALQVGLLTVRDTLDCEVVFMAGDVDITEQVLEGDMLLKLGVRLNTSEGKLLAVSDPHLMVNGVANCVLNLDTPEMREMVETYPNSAARSIKVFFEVEVSRPDGSYCQTITQVQFSLQFEVNIKGDLSKVSAFQVPFTPGDSIPFKLSMFKDNGGLPVASLAGWKVDFAILRSGSDADSAGLVKMSSAGGSIVLGGNVASWVVRSTDSEILEYGKTYAFRVRVTTPAGITATLVTGALKPPQT